MVAEGTSVGQLHTNVGIMAVRQVLLVTIPRFHWSWIHDRNTFFPSTLRRASVMKVREHP